MAREEKIESIVMGLKPACENCRYELDKAEKCAVQILGSREFDVNQKAKILLTMTPLKGFCEYHEPKEGMENRVDYSFKIDELRTQ